MEGHAGARAVGGRQGMEKLIIEARVNEYAMRKVNAKVPWTAAEIGADAALCRAAGAAIVHFHARQEDGAPSHDAEVYGACISSIRSKPCDTPITMLLIRARVNPCFARCSGLSLGRVTVTTPSLTATVMAGSQSC